MLRAAGFSMQLLRKNAKSGWVQYAAALQLRRKQESPYTLRATRWCKGIHYNIVVLLASNPNALIGTRVLQSSPIGGS